MNPTPEHSALGSFYFLPEFQIFTGDFQFPQTHGLTMEQKAPNRILPGFVKPLEGLLVCLLQADALESFSFCLSSQT